jgi:hypothetical protein
MLLQLSAHVHYIVTCRGPLLKISGGTRLVKTLPKADRDYAMHFSTVYRMDIPSVQGTQDSKAKNGLCLINDENTLKSLGSHQRVSLPWSTQRVVAKCGEPTVVHMWPRESSRILSSSRQAFISLTFSASRPR